MLEAQIPVQAARRVLVNDEARSVCGRVGGAILAALAALAAGRLGRVLEVAPLAVALESAGGAAGRHDFCATLRGLCGGLRALALGAAGLPASP